MRIIEKIIIEYLFYFPFCLLFSIAWAKIGFRGKFDVIGLVLDWKDMLQLAPQILFLTNLLSLILAVYFSFSERDT